MICESEPQETGALVELARQTDVFKPHELVALSEVLIDYHARERANGHRSMTYKEGARILGFAYYAPASMTDRGWYLYWIAVNRSSQATGIGSALMQFVEQDIVSRQARMLWIETSSLPHYELTRRFYLKHGYNLACTLADFYSDGDSLMVYCKRLPHNGPRR